MANNEEINIKVKIVDKEQTKNDFTAVRSHIQGETQKANKALKDSAKETSAYSKKLNEQARELAFRFVGMGAAVGGFVALGKAIKDAGLNTEGANKSMSRISATVGSVLLPDAQALFDMFSKNGDTIAKTAAIVVKAIKEPFDALTYGMLGATEIVNRALALFGNKSAGRMAEALKSEREALGKEMGNWEIEVINKVKSPEEMKAARDKAKAEAEKERARLATTFSVKGGVGAFEQFDATQSAYQKTAEEHGGYVKSFSESEYAKTKAATLDKEIQDAKFEQIDALRVKNEEFRKGEMISENEYVANKISLAQKEKEITASRIATAQDYSSMLVSTLQSVAQKNKEFAIAYKVVAIADATVKGIQSAITAYKLGWEAGGAYGGAALSAIYAGISVAYTAAQIAAISSQQFESGGIVSGNSYTGDRIPIRVNSSEMILNTTQQRRLFDIADGKTSNVGGPAVHFHINNSDGSQEHIVSQVRSGNHDRYIREFMQRAEAVMA